MYSYGDRIRAVKFYINCGYNAAYTVLKLGYLDIINLKHWYREYSQYQYHHQKKRNATSIQILKKTAFDYYFAHDKSSLQTVKVLSDPSHTLFLIWIKELHP